MSSKKFLVCGLGKVGCSVANTLDKMFFDVVGIDASESVVANIRNNSEFRFMCYVANATEQQFIENLRAVEDFNVAIIAISDFFSRLLCTKIIKNYAKAVGREIEVIAWAGNKFEESMLIDVGARRFIRVEENLGKYLAYTASSDNVLDFNSLRLQETIGVDKVDVETLQDAYAVTSISVPKNFKGNKIKDFSMEYIDSSQKIIAAYTPNSTSLKEPVFCDSAGFETSPLRPGDTLIICGYHDKLKKLLRNLPN